nr:hypothetical transcript [Hymenolepis microstoma]
MKINASRYFHPNILKVRISAKQTSDRDDWICSKQLKEEICGANEKVHLANKKLQFINESDLSRGNDNHSNKLTVELIVFENPRGK